MKNYINKRICAITITFITALNIPCIAFSAPPVVSTDEAVYVNLDYYGALSDMRIVKGVSLNGETAFTDYGNYSKVYNMSTHDKPIITNDTVSWNLSVPDKQRFYYECIPSDNNYLQMPWTFDVSYKLDDVPIKAEELPGVKGLVEVTVHAIPNNNASDYYKNNMTLTVTTGIDMENTNSIEAPGAQIQSFGSYKVIVFLGLPGEDNTYTIRISSDKFESTGLVMMMTPASMSQFDKISDFRNIKDKVSDASDDIYASMNDLLTTFNSMSDSLSSMSAGISGLNDVRKQLIESRSVTDLDTDQTLNSLQKLTDQVDSMVPELTLMQENLLKFQSNTNDILDTIIESQDNIKPYHKALKHLITSLNDVTDMLKDIENETSENNNLDQIRNNLSEALLNLSSVSSDFSNTLESLENSLDYLIDNDLISDPTVLNILQNETFTDLLGDSKKILNTMDLISSSGQDTLEMIDNYKDIMEDCDMSSLTDSAAKLTKQANYTLDSINELMNELPELENTINNSVPLLNSVLFKSSQLLKSVKETLATTNQTLTNLQTTLRSVRDKADGSTTQAIDGTLDMIQKAIDSSDNTKDLQTANSSIHNAINNEIDDLEDDSNVLNIDNSLALQSVTSGKNPSPSSLQFIFRTKEISIDDQNETQTQEQNQADEGAIHRILNIFHKIYDSLSSVFSSND